MIGTKGLLSKVQSLIFSHINKIFPEQILLFILGIKFQCLTLKREDVAFLLSGRNQLSKINSKFSKTAYSILYIYKCCVIQQPFLEYFAESLEAC